VGADVSGEGVFGDVLIVCPAGDDEDGEAEEDALAAASIGNRSVVGGGSGHGGDGLRDSVGEEEEEVKRLEVLMCAETARHLPRSAGAVMDPQNNSAREKDIVIDDALLKRLEKRKTRYDAKSSSLIFPNSKGKPNNHLIRVLQRLAKEAGVEGRIGMHKFVRHLPRWSRAKKALKRLACCWDTKTS